MTDETGLEQGTEINWVLVADWLKCPSCKSTDVNVRRNRYDGEVLLHCPKCHEKAIAVSGDPITEGNYDE